MSEERNKLVYTPPPERDLPPPERVKSKFLDMIFKKKGKGGGLYHLHIPPLITISWDPDPHEML